MSRREETLENKVWELERDIDAKKKWIVILAAFLVGFLIMMITIGVFRSVHLSQDTADIICQELTNDSDSTGHGYINSKTDEHVSPGGMVCRIGDKTPINSNLRIVSEE